MSDQEYLKTNMQAKIEFSEKVGYLGDVYSKNQTLYVNFGKLWIPLSTFKTSGLLVLEGIKE